MNELSPGHIRQRRGRGPVHIAFVWSMPRPVVRGPALWALLLLYQEMRCAPRGWPEFSHSDSVPFCLATIRGIVTLCRLAVSGELQHSRRTSITTAPRRGLHGLEIEPALPSTSAHSPAKALLPTLAGLIPIIVSNLIWWDYVSTIVQPMDRGQWAKAGELLHFGRNRRGRFAAVVS